MVTTSDAEDEFTIPAENTTMPTAAPNAAPCDTPSVDADAKGLRSTHCITAPEPASIAPANSPANTLGNRIPIRIVSLCVLPFPINVSSTSPNEIRYGPAPDAYRQTIPVNKETTSNAIFLRFINR